MLSLCEPLSRSSPSSLVCGAPAEVEKLDWRLRPGSLERNVRRILNTLQTSHTETVITPQYSGAGIHYKQNHHLVTAIPGYPLGDI